VAKRQNKKLPAFVFLGRVALENLLLATSTLAKLNFWRLVKKQNVNSIESSCFRLRIMFAALLFFHIYCVKKGDLDQTRHYGGHWSVFSRLRSQKGKRPCQSCRRDQSKWINISRMLAARLYILQSFSSVVMPPTMVGPSFFIPCGFNVPRRNLSGMRT
jgi:hypothetical protein